MALAPTMQPHAEEEQVPMGGLSDFSSLAPWHGPSLTAASVPSRPIHNCHFSVLHLVQAPRHLPKPTTASSS